MSYESGGFASRHIGPKAADELQMLNQLGYKDI